MFGGGVKDCVKGVNGYRIRVWSHKGSCEGLNVVKCDVWSVCSQGRCGLANGICVGRALGTGRRNRPHGSYAVLGVTVEGRGQRRLVLGLDEGFKLRTGATG